MRYVFLILFVLIPRLHFAGEVSNTSKCFDLLCVPQYFDQIKGNARFAGLCADSVFVRCVADINSACTASNLCNLYSQLGGDKDDVSQCLHVVQRLDSLAATVGWAGGILSVKSQLGYVMQRLADCGYSEYWDETVYPKLKSHIDNYKLDKDLLAAIHDSLAAFFHPETLPDAQSRIFILDIGNAFNLSDESFCCTPLILDPEIEKRLRLNFMNIYIHENLHNLYLSPEVMARLDGLGGDAFYSGKEAIARKYGEGGNEAFTVAAEVYVSSRLGLRDAQNVYDEFSQYVDGSLVLAPIVYVNLPDRHHGETYNDFLLQLFDKGILKSGCIEVNYNAAMNAISEEVKDF